MCDHEDSSGVPVSFAQLVSLFQQPPFEPCQSELEFLTLADYNALFAEKWKRYFRPVRLYIAHITEDREAAADLTQKVFISLYYAKASFEPAYIYRAAKNAALDEFRRRNRESRALHAYWRGIKPDKRYNDQEVDEPDPHPLQDEVLVERAREEAVRRAIDRLPENFRVPLELLASGKSYKQIIEITQVNEGTVKSRICRGKVILQRRLRVYL
jgi:RNA polymerase sigma-70 factor (ECF subfamily)